ncbi:extracellular solute-binding protein, partial [Schumannella luteola]
IDFFGELNTAGNMLKLDVTSATVASGETPVVFDWDYLNATHVADNPDWKVRVLPGTGYAGYYNQAINKDAPHPAAARLWQEFLYSDEAQNLWLKGGARPARMEAMIAAGTIDADAA